MTSDFMFNKINIYSLLKLRSMMKTLRIEDMKAVEKSIFHAQGTWGWKFPYMVGGKLSILLTLRDRLKALKKRSGFGRFHVEIMDNYKGANDIIVPAEMMDNYKGAKSGNNIIFLGAVYGTYASGTHIWRISRNKYVLYPVGIKGQSNSGGHHT